MLVGRKQEKLDAAAAAIRERGGTAATHATDVRDYPGVQAAVASASNQFGGIDILVCGAAGNFPAPVLSMSANGFKAVIDIDLIGTFNTCRASYEHLNKPGASVMAISASFAFQPTAMQAHVGAGKAGVDILIKTLAIEWGPSGVRCNCITPGPTDDTEGMRRLAPDEAARKRVEKGVPLRRFGTKDELADLALFLCSDAAKYITGGIYLCDGGMSLSRPSSWLETQ
jgi:NAD(P)-dependent dehydrogenase (short-subunit alcohol dehydrogenase family)